MQSERLVEAQEDVGATPTFPTKPSSSEWYAPVTGASEWYQTCALSVG